MPTFSVFGPKIWLDLVFGVFIYAQKFSLDGKRARKKVSVKILHELYTNRLKNIFN